MTSEEENKPLTFLSIMDTIRYFETQGIKLDRKTLSTHLNNGTMYKGFIFQYDDQ